MLEPTVHLRSDRLCVHPQEPGSPSIDVRQEFVYYILQYITSGSATGLTTPSVKKCLGLVFRAGFQKQMSREMD